MIPTIIFDANKFIEAVDEIKMFWFSSKLNKLRIEAHKESQKIDFISINRESGLETVASISGFVQADFVLYAKKIMPFYNAATLLQQINVGKNNPLKLRIIPGKNNREHFSLEVSLQSIEFVASTSDL